MVLLRCEVFGQHFVRRVKAQQEEFNRQVNVHNMSANMFNVSCGKKYYGDDMEKAKSLAGL